MIVNRNIKMMLVIFLTLLFSIIDVLISNYTLLVSCLFCFVIIMLVSVLSLAMQRSRMIDESMPTFLNFVNLTMSTGKSLANSFEIAILYQRKSIQPFYKRIYHRIFYLKEEKSFLFSSSQDDFYQKIFQISLKSSHQRERMNQLKAQIIEKMEMNKKEKSLKAPFIAQIIIFCMLYFTLLAWHFGFRQRHLEIELLSASLFLVGIFFSIFIGRRKKVV